MLEEYCYKKGIDVPIYVTYFKIDTTQYVIDTPINYSQLASVCETREEMARVLLDRCNALGKMEIDSQGNIVDNTNEKQAIA